MGGGGGQYFRQKKAMHELLSILLDLGLLEVHKGHPFAEGEHTSLCRSLLFLPEEGTHHPEAWRHRAQHTACTEPVLP